MGRGVLRSVDMRLSQSTFCARASQGAQQCIIYGEDL